MPRPNVLDPTHAKPEPWFVGSGRGLMIVVLLTCAVLVVVRAVQLVQIGEAAWTRWHARPAVPNPVPTPPPPLPLSARSTDARTWFTTDDYPSDAIRAEQTGRTRVSIRFARDGMPTACRVVAGSGHPSLDRATCRAAMRRARAVPAPPGSPEPEIVKSVSWRLPPD